jgi:putative inorganic carbon (hco3(-)) transporter
MRDYVLTAFIFAIIPVCLVRPWLGIIAWYWLGIMNPHRNTWDFAYTMPFAILIGGATLFGLLFARDRKLIPWNRELVLMVILMVYFTFTTLFAWAPTEAWVQWQKVFKIILMTIVATMLIYGRDRIRTIMWTIVISIGFYGVKGFFFVLRSGGAERVQGPDGSFLEGNTFIGLAFTMVVPLMIMMARAEHKVWFKRFLYGMAILTIISTIFTYSRGAFLGLGVILVLMFLNAQKKVLAACILIPAALLAPVVLPESVFQRADKIENYQSDGSANQRLQSWTVAFNLALDRPVTGAGFEFEYSPDEARWLSYGSEKYTWALQHSSAAHSIYFQVLGQHGFIAFLLYLALLFGTLISLSRTKRWALSNPSTTWVAGYASGLQLGLMGYMMSGAFLSSAYFDLAWLYFALSAILAREVTEVATRRYGVNSRFVAASPTQKSMVATGAADSAKAERRPISNESRARW